MAVETKEQKTEREASELAEQQAAEREASELAAQQAAEREAAELAAQQAAELVEVRVLLAFGEHQPNDVATVSAAELASLKGAGQVDDDPAAVAYARSLIDAG